MSKLFASAMKQRAVEKSTGKTLVSLSNQKLGNTGFTLWNHLWNRENLKKCDQKVWNGPIVCVSLPCFTNFCFPLHNEHPNQAKMYKIFLAEHTQKWFSKETAHIDIFNLANNANINPNMNIIWKLKVLHLPSPRLHNLKNLLNRKEQWETAATIPKKC